MVVANGEANTVMRQAGVPEENRYIWLLTGQTSLGALYSSALLGSLTQSWVALLSAF